MSGRLRIPRFLVLTLTTLAVSGEAGSHGHAKEPTAKDPTPERLSAEFTSANWASVRSAKDALESMQAEAIPILVSLLGRDEYVKLQDTADLIYPGATKFWGHGGIVDYDIDWLSVRAGWALEDLTFQSFGFREGSMDHDALIKAVMAGKADVPLADLVPLERDLEVKRERRARASAAAAAWWARSSEGWNRLAALRDALKSGDPIRQVSALNWIRHGDTRCDGLSKQEFTLSILPEVRRLSGSGDPGVKEQADHVVRDFEANEWYWLRLKDPEKRKRRLEGEMPHEHRMPATAGGAAVPNSRVRRSPAAPDAER